MTDFRRAVVCWFQFRASRFSTTSAFSVMNPFNCAADYPGTNPASAAVNVSAGFAQVQAGVTVGGALSTSPDKSVRRQAHSQCWGRAAPTSY